MLKDTIPVAIVSLMIQSHIVTEGDYATLSSSNDDFECLVDMLNRAIRGEKMWDPLINFEIDDITVVSNDV